MPTRTARTAWNGTLQEGSGQVELTSSKVGTYEVSFPKRAADEAGGTTSPEELIAAAHSSCYAMQLSALIAKAGGTPQSLDVTADVSLGPDSADGGFRLTGIALTVRGEVERPGRRRLREGRPGRQGQLPGQQGAHRRRDHRWTPRSSPDPPARRRPASPRRRGRRRAGVSCGGRASRHSPRGRCTQLGLAGLPEPVEPAEQGAERGHVVGR